MTLPAIGVVAVLVLLVADMFVVIAKFARVLFALDQDKGE